MELICIDLEASGLGPESYPIEVAWVNAESGDQDSFLIDPGTVQGWEFWDDFAEEMHGIDRAQLAAEGVSAAAACRRLNQALAGTTPVCDAYDFDFFWLSRLFESQGVAMAFRLRGAQSLLTPEQLSRYEQLSSAQSRSHRALDDALDLVRLFKQLRTERA